MNHLLSVIVPVHNAEKYLEKSLQSVLNQTYNNIEVILVDDGSTDRSNILIGEAAKKDPRIKAFHRENSGVSATRNFGFTKASGDLIAFADADDQLDPIMYEVLIDALDNTESDVSACTYKREYTLNSIRLQTNYKSVSSPITFNDLGEIYASITRHVQSIEGFVWNKVWKASVIEKHRFRTDIQMCEDSIFTWQVMKDVHKVCFVDTPLYHYLIQSNSSTRKANHNQCLTAVEAYSLMLNDSDLLSEECITDLSKQYLVWNIMAFQSLINDPNAKNEQYEVIRKNLVAKSDYIDLLDVKNRIEAKSISRSFATGKRVVGALERLKMVLKR